jgi:DNA-binding beta-propeller fold protein YncE
VGLVPEWLAYDSRRDVFYLSSLNRRKIVRISRAGIASDFVPEGRYGLLPVLGIRPDPDTGTVWAASWAEETNKSELLHSDGSGTLLGRFSPNGTREHGFNDLVIGEDGDILLTDSLTNEVLRFDTISHSFQSLKVNRDLSAPNGIAISPDLKKLYVADDFGIVLVDTQTGLSSDVHAGPHSTLAGIDGLYSWNGNLIAVQNAIGSPRIAMFRLSKDGKQVVRTTVLENRPSFRFVPTTSAIRGQDLYFIIDSRADKMKGDNVIDRAKLKATSVGVLRLPTM